MTHSPTAKDIPIGAIAGAAATVPMSGLMWGAQQLGLMGQQPPEKVTKGMLHALRIHPSDDDTTDVLSLLNHLAFGATLGVMYRVVHRWKPDVVPDITFGAAFGLGVWASAYEKWLPEIGWMPPPEEDRPGRPASMIAAHLVFGCTLAALERRLDR